MNLAAWNDHEAQPLTEQQETSDGFVRHMAEVGLRALPSLAKFEFDLLTAEANLKPT